MPNAKSKITFTVCTPTFNRAHTLERVFNSLMNQTFHNFEWVVIDDGSSDRTGSLVEEFQRRAFFEVRYQFQPNQGKHIAVNAGAKLAKGEFFLIADSDDSFPGNALSVFYETWLTIPEEKRKSFTGVTGLCATNSGNIVGDRYPLDVFDSTPAETFYRYGIKGEKWGFHRTAVIRSFPFPELKGFKYFGEGIIWNAIGRKYLTRYVNQIVRTYNQDAGDQLTHQTPRKTSPARIFYVMGLNADQDYLHVAPLICAKIATQGARFSLHQGDTFSTQYSRLKGTKLKVLWTLALPLGMLLYLRDLFAERRYPRNA